jgi:hypothetical protein
VRSSISLGFFGRQRGRIEDDVLEDFDQFAAHAEHHQGTEPRVAVHPEDHLPPPDAHLLDIDAENIGIGAFLGMRYIIRSKTSMTS